MYGLIDNPIDTDGLITNPIDSKECADTNVSDDDVNMLISLARLVLRCKCDDFVRNCLLVKVMSCVFSLLSVGIRTLNTLEYTRRPP